MKSLKLKAKSGMLKCSKDKIEISTKVLTKLLAFSFLLSAFSLFSFSSHAQSPINRQKLVQRHNVVVTKIDSLSSLSVGNGKFAFTVDATGLQTFPDAYAKGVSLGTESEWCWDSFKDTVGYKFEESLKEYNQYGRKVTYSVQVNTPQHSKDAANWFRQNVHRVQMGNVGLLLTRKDGTEAKPADIRNIRQTLDLWTGEITSSFQFDGVPVTVVTVSHQELDAIGVHVASKLIAEGRLKIRIRFPYPTGEWADVGNNWSNAGKHQSKMLDSAPGTGILEHRLAGTTYYAALAWKQAALLSASSAHTFSLEPRKWDDALDFTVNFVQDKPLSSKLTFSRARSSSIAGWKSFWTSGGAVDFSGSTDPRANELERRVILSQYLTKIQCAGDYPPQETGLTYNSWFGKPHLEMHWWHGVDFPLWGRPELLEKSMEWYFKVAGKAKAIALRQGFDGVRWQKMTDNDGNESPSSVGALLIWQQPHFITFAELDYRAHPDKKTIDKYKDLVFATADFMASFAHFNPEKNRYELGKGLIPAQEQYKPEDTYNPTYELAYWEWALKTAQTWLERAGLPRNKKWDDVIAKLSPLPVQNGVYLAAESAPDSYTNPEYIKDHPSVFGAFGMLPETKNLDKTVMKSTYNLIWNTWSWNNTWGWDFPMTAMTAARLGMPDKAIDALFKDVHTNIYLVNGHNYQDERLRIYLPGNGGLLTAVAMMCAGWDGSTEKNPGFPKDGTWQVRWEGLKKMP